MTTWISSRAGLAKRDAVIGCVIGLIALVSTPLVGKLSTEIVSRDFHLPDESGVVYAALRSTVNDIPHIGFPYFYAGGYELALGVVFRIFGASFGVARWTLGISMALTVVALYFIFRLARLRRDVSAFFSLSGVVFAHFLNFHAHPAWIASMLLVVAAALVLAVGTERVNLRFWYMGAGVLIGFATMVKQNSGIYGLLGLTLALLLDAIASAFVGAPHLPPRGRVGRMAGMLILFSVPVVIFALVLYVMRQHLSIDQVVFLFMPPVACTAFIAVNLPQLRREGWCIVDGAVVDFVRRILLLGTGFFLGLLPVSIYYGMHDGFGRFIQESFLSVQAEFTRAQPDWPFFGIEGHGSVTITFRRVLLHIVPLLSLGIGLTFAIFRLRQRRWNSAARVMLFGACLISFTHLTLYPVPGTAYLFYMIPLQIIPFAVIFDAILEEWAHRRFYRAGSLVMAFSVVCFGYLTTRLVAGDIEGVKPAGVTLLAPPRGDIYEPVELVQQLSPIVQYLSQQDTTRGCIFYGRHGATVSFLTGRRQVEDYALRYYTAHGLGDPEMQDFVSRVRAARPGVVIVAKQYLTGTATEQELFQVLAEGYTLVVDTDTHLVYKRV